MAVKRRPTKAKRKIFRGKKRKTTYKTQMAVAKKVVQQADHLQVHRTRQYLCAILRSKA